MVTGVGVSDFLETRLGAGVDLFIVLLPVEVFDIFERVMPSNTVKMTVKFYDGIRLGT
jgi:hypothetical protein